MCFGQDIPALPDQVCQFLDHEADRPKTSRNAAMFLSPVQTLNAVWLVCAGRHMSMLKTSKEGERFWCRSPRRAENSQLCKCVFGTLVAKSMGLL